MLKLKLLIAASIATVLAALGVQAATQPAHADVHTGFAQFHVYWSFNPSGDFSAGTQIEGTYRYTNIGGIEYGEDITDLDLECAGGPFDPSKTWALNGEGFNWGGLSDGGDYNQQWNVAGNMSRGDCGGFWKDFDPTGTINYPTRRPHVEWDYILNRLNGSTPETHIELTIFSGSACGASVKSGVGQIALQYQTGSYKTCTATKLS